MKRKLYAVLAGMVGAYHRCLEKAEGLLDTGTDEERKHWEEMSAQHEKRIHDLVKEHMPSGSGFDSGTELDLDRSTDEMLVFTTSYHHMNEDGMYDGWTEHEVRVKASLWAEFHLRITGRDRNDTKEYMYEVFGAALSQEVE